MSDEPSEAYRLSIEISHLARLALHGSRSDVELYVHRLAYRYRGTPLGDELALHDVLPPVSLRKVTP